MVLTVKIEREKAKIDEEDGEPSKKYRETLLSISLTVGDSRNISIDFFFCDANQCECRLVVRRGRMVQ